jgi:threonine/homoserine/homoserine lactone efflux protein
VLNYLFIFLYSIAFSFVISLPIGGVNMAVFQATLNHHQRAGYMIGFGAILAEAIYCAIPMFGLTPLLEELGIMKFLYFLFIPVLLFMGCYTIWKTLKPKPALANVKEIESRVRAHHRSMKGYFVYGFFLCASNPMTFVFWIQTVVFLRTEGIVDNSWSQILAWFAGVPVGTWLLYFGFVQLARITRRRMNELWKDRLNITIGVIFILLAIYISIGYFLGHGDVNGAQS